MDSVDKVQVVQADWTVSECPCTMSTLPLNLSSEPMDIVHCILDFVHGLSGQSLWTLSSLPELPGLCPLNPWTMTSESMSNVQGVHGQCPGSPLIQ